MFISLCVVYFRVSKILLANICLRTFFDIPFTLFLMLVIKSKLYDIISCTSLGIVPVHYTFMYMDEREESSRLVKTRILLISVLNTVLNTEFLIIICTIILCYISSIAPDDICVQFCKCHRDITSSERHC